MAYDPSATIDPQGGIPPYRQLAGILAARIERGDWAPGKLIPSLSRLEQEYEVARNTARKAIKLLDDQCLVVVDPQWGTYVAQQGDQTG